MEAEEPYYELTPLLAELTEELKAEISAGVHCIVKRGMKESCIDNVWIPGIIERCSRESAIMAIQVIQEKGQIFAIHPNYKELGSTPWFNDLTDKLFEAINS